MVSLYRADIDDFGIYLTFMFLLIIEIYFLIYCLWAAVILAAISVILDFMVFCFVMNDKIEENQVDTTKFYQSWYLFARKIIMGYAT